MDVLFLSLQGTMCVFNLPNYCSNQRLIFTFCGVIATVALRFVLVKKKFKKKKLESVVRAVRANRIGQLPPPA